MTSLMAKPKTKALILCAGSGSRWGNYLGVPKQLIPIRGEALVHRMVRSLHENRISDIDVIAQDARLQVDGCGFFKPSRSRCIVETLLSTKDLWQKHTIILLGDVFYSDYAMQTITNSDRRVRVFGRPGASSVTGKPWGEIFAIAFNQNGIKDVLHCTRIVLGDAVFGRSGKLWQLYRSLIDTPLDSHQTEATIFLTIDDITDDFDFPEDYRRFVRLFSQNA